MNIKLKRRYLYYLNYKIKCSIGKRGLTNNKFEGDLKTPKGTFQLKKIYYRKDRIRNLKPTLKTIAIQKNMGWCDDVKSKFYNKLIKFPFKFTAETLWRKDNTYDIFIVLNYNLNPIKKNRGSAIFLHLAKNDYKPTKGCVAIKKKDMIHLINNIKKNSRITI